nr:MAG TPA: hypothetical protein [Caudoviricetes sp.]
MPFTENVVPNKSIPLIFLLHTNIKTVFDIEKPENLQVTQNRKLL